MEEECTGTFTDANPGKHPVLESILLWIYINKNIPCFFSLVLLSYKLGKTLADKRKSVMNDNEGDWATLSWQEAWARGMICVSPPGGSEACFRKVMCTVGMEQDSEFKAAAYWLSPLPKKTPLQFRA